MALACLELPLRVLWIGRIEPEKRLLEFIEAAALAAEHTGPGTLEVRVAGDGTLRPAAERLVRRLAAAGILTRTPGVDGMAATLAELVRIRSSSSTPRGAPRMPRAASRPRRTCSRCGSCTARSLRRRSTRARALLASTGAGSADFSTDRAQRACLA